MAESNNSSALHWILGAALLLIALFVVVALVGVNSQADEINSSAGVTNTAPTVDSVFFDSGATYQIDANGAAESDDVIELTSGSNTVMNISGAVTDANGDDDIGAIVLSFYSAGAAGGEGCSSDPNDCYKNMSCGTAALDSDSLKYNCAITMAFWTNSSSTGGAEADTDWTAKVDVTDAQGASGSKSATIDVETLLSLNMPGPINWGTLAQSYNTGGGDNVDQVVTQKGNDKADITAYGTDMPCSNVGTIPVGQIKKSITDDYGWSDASATALSGNPGSPSNLDVTIPYQQSASAVTHTVHWDIRIPDYDVSGVCTGTITMAAVASAD